MSVVYSTTSTWKGFSAIRRLVIFGDSYSSVEYSNKHDESKPSAGNPLGVYYPGSENYGLWNEPDQPNWVGHLITKYRPGPRYTPPEEPSIPGRWDDQSQDWIENPLLVNDYAMGGDTVHGVVRQVETMYLPGLGKNPPKAPWTAEETLFVTWVGINDCAFIVSDTTIMALFEVQDKLYKTGARNFLFIDVPPIERSPAVGKANEARVAKTYVQWNINLREAAKSFSSTHADSSVFVFSSFDLFHTILGDPTTYGFEAADVKRRGGSVWVDHLHPTSKVHDHIAEAIAKFLTEIPTTNQVV